MMNKVLTDKQLLELIDDLNKDGFKYFGIRYILSGNKEEVLANYEFMKNMKSKPFKIIEMDNTLSTPKDLCLKHSIVINLSQPRVYIYEVDENKELVNKYGISKERVILMLKWKEELK